MNDRNADSFLLRRLGSLQRPVSHDAMGINRHIFSLSENHGLANPVARLGRINILQVVSAEPDIAGAVKSDGSLYRQSCLHSVAGSENRHVGNGAHNSHVIDGLMSRPVSEIGHARAGTHHLHIELCRGNALTDLIVSPSRRKYRKGVGKRNFSRQCQASRKAGHILLRNSHLKIPVRKRLFKQAAHGRFSQIRFQHYDIRIFSTQFH